jgi:hypothetical protein
MTELSSRDRCQAGISAAHRGPSEKWRIAKASHDVAVGAVVGKLIALIST